MLGMRLRLQHPPTPEHMSDHAEIAVTAAANVEGIALDYQVSSLPSVDAILGRFHEQGLTPDQIGETVFSFGAYIGEVMVRSANGSWTTLPPEHPLAASWPVVTLPLGTVANPIGKAFKRLTNGDGESVPYFYHAMTAS
jgi:hypothetical protein